ncbi:hypothetical protein [Labrys okinawensis]|uniref:hypothetical protein n=1 Tax=Labrys okinawensis TaxID=346911 RepID=UPI001AECA321|nr:hypothetical protein [Labrys okinawensis]
MSEGYLQTLQREFQAGEGSFVLRLRSDLQWDRQAFGNLVSAMQACCREHESTQVLDRWMAEGFWYTQWFVRSWVDHPNFPRTYTQDYYQKACTRLDDLAQWFFSGINPYEGESGLDPIE